MTYLSDRRRVELALVPRLYAMWVRGALDIMHKAGKTDVAGLVAELERLMLAENEALDGAAERAKLEARVARAANRLYDDVAPRDGTEGANMTRVFLQLAILTNDLIASGHVEVVAGGQFDQAYTALKDGIVSTAERDADVAGLLDAVDRAATKGAARMRRMLTDMGLFRPVAVGRAAA